MIIITVIIREPNQSLSNKYGENWISFTALGAPSEPTWEHRRMGTVEDDELRHHLWVVNGEQPRDGPAPVMAN